MTFTNQKFDFGTAKVICFFCFLWPSSPVFSGWKGFGKVSENVGKKLENVGKNSEQNWANLRSENSKNLKNAQILL